MKEQRKYNYSLQNVKFTPPRIDVNFTFDNYVHNPLQKVSFQMPSARDFCIYMSDTVNQIHKLSKTFTV